MKVKVERHVAAGVNTEVKGPRLKAEILPRSVITEGEVDIAVEL
jgi:hypothetical protein